MANYWIGDAKSRVLGPITMEALSQLVGSGRIHGIVKVSTDGTNWAPIEQYPEIARLQAEHAGEALRAYERKEAQRLREQLATMKGRPSHEIFGLAQDATVEAHRAAFFRLVKQFYPDRLSADSAPELRAISGEIFLFLSGLMASIEKRAAAPAGKPRPPVSAPAAPASVPRPPPALAPSKSKEVSIAAILEYRRSPHGPAPDEPRPVPATPRARLRAAAAEPTYEPHEFVGLERRADDRIEVTVKVTVATCSIFTENKLLNISSSGAFIPCKQALDLGTELDLVFKFDKPSREVKASGSVVWWNAGDAKQVRGFGVRFKNLAKEDRGFIEQFVREAATARR
ncbi:MAG TPA: TIGR02266 family protein [Myxococcales bacterium]|nr:TIGR02266 family protein [Myxococcales bacterium]